MDRSKLKDVINWPTPKTGNSIERDLGLLNYFRDFIPLYSTIAAPLERMRKMPTISTKDWTPDRQAAFRALRDVLVNSPILSHPDFSKPFCVATDASNVGIGAVLYQFGTVKLLIASPIAYESDSQQDLFNLQNVTIQQRSVSC